jgi:hypothetical protein
MDILDSLRQAPGAELYRLYLAIGKMLDGPRRILEIRQRLHLGMAVNYIGDNPLGPPAQGTIVELRQTQAVWYRTTQLDAVGACSMRRSSRKLRLVSLTSNRHRRRERSAKSSSL